MRRKKTPQDYHEIAASCAYQWESRRSDSGCMSTAAGGI
jgi:hypothetical protein